MKIVEKTAVARIFVDLIKADRIVDTGEIGFWHKICAKYALDRDIQVKARTISFAEALQVICNTEDTAMKIELLNDCRAMTVSDGFCSHTEALLMIALTTLLSPESPFEGEVLSMPLTQFDIDTATALYIESDTDHKANDTIQANYRSISKELQLAGFHFVYIPKIIDQYRTTSTPRFKDILSFLAPEMSDASINNTYDRLMGMTTGDFCKDLLCNKCGFTQLRATAPSLLIKIGNSFVGDVKYANYLRLDIDGALLTTIHTFIDSFTEMLRADVIVINNTTDGGNQFLFHSFHKQLLEIFLVRSDVRSRIVIDLCKEEISLPDIDAKVTGLHRREKALYVLLLCQGSEGLNFKQPTSAAERAKYERRMKQIQHRYNAIYQAFGGNLNTVSDLSVPEIRRPIISCIRSSLRSLQSLYNPQDYSISNGPSGHISVHIEPDLVFVQSLDSPTPLPLRDSPLYRTLTAL